MRTIAMYGVYDKAGENEDCCQSYPCLAPLVHLEGNQTPSQLLQRKMAFSKRIQCSVHVRDAIIYLNRTKAMPRLIFVRVLSFFFVLFENVFVLFEMHMHCIVMLTIIN